MKDLRGKRILVIGGAFQHCKLVEAARELGVITYVTDYLPLEKAPAKQIADHYYMYNITDIDTIVEMCREQHIDGVISTSLDICQKPYQKICEQLGLPCFGTEEQFRILTDKTAFKEYCRKTGVDTIPEYKTDDFESAQICDVRVQFPVLIKPGESRGSRGQSVCWNYEEALQGIEFARTESANNQVVIEKYMGQMNDFSMTILVLNGKAYPFRTVDRFLGNREDQLDKLAVGSASPSVFTDIYMDHVHGKVDKLCRDIGLKNAPVFMQGFVDGETIRFYDPGLRLPGGEYERMFQAACGKNPLYPLIEFALTGQVSEDSAAITTEDVWLCGRTVGQVLPTLRPGIISKIKGLEEIKEHPNVVSVFARYTLGDEVKPTHNVNQRFCEVDIVCDSSSELAEIMDWVYHTLVVLDERGENMLISRMDTQRVKDRYADAM